jgi:hypothetical protein
LRILDWRSENEDFSSIKVSVAKKGKKDICRN